MIRDHRRAIRAEEHVRGVQLDQRKAYGAICMKLPILVHQAGLAPALHHVAQLSKLEKRAILEHLAVQLGDGGLLQAPHTADRLLAHVRSTDTVGLIATTREVLRCLEWYKCFAKSILKVEATEDGE